MVKPFGDILVPYDDSLNLKSTLTKAFALVELTNATITLVHVISYHGAMAKIVEPYKESIINHVKRFFNKVKRDTSRRDDVIKEQTLYWSPAEEILNFMKNKKFGTVVMGRRSVTKITGPSLGSVSDIIVQNSKILVLVVT